MGSHWDEKIRRYLQSPYPVAYQRWKVVLIFFPGCISDITGFTAIWDIRH